MHRSFIIATFSLLLATACAHGKIRMIATGERGIAVVGTGKASAPPDIARTSIGVEVRGPEVQQAVTEANTRMSAITGAIKALGIADKDLRTHSFSIGFEQEPTPPPGPVPAQLERGAAPAAAAPAGPRGFYRVSNMLEVTIRDLSAVGRVLAAATGAGANNVWGINFELENTEPLKTQARAQAVQHAQQNANELAQLSGVKLGKVISVSEGESEGRPGGPVLMSMRAAANEDVPIERGEITVNYGVRVLYDVRDGDD
ncbi:MAG TPA: SIMPL domain-containing protein [Polyangiales bacterium]|nr:SIMPL domain-containing protein [Polyangiales bacterium]